MLHPKLIALRQFTCDFSTSNASISIYLSVSQGHATSLTWIQVSLLNATTLHLPKDISLNLFETTSLKEQLRHLFAKW